MVTVRSSFVGEGEALGEGCDVVLGATDWLGESVAAEDVGAVADGADVGDADGWNEQAAIPKNRRGARSTERRRGCMQRS